MGPNLDGGVPPEVNEIVVDGLEIVRRPATPKKSSTNALDTFLRCIVIPALAAILLVSLASVSRYAVATLRSAAPPRMEEDLAFGPIVAKAMRTIPASEPVLVFPEQAPYFFTYYLYPRPTYLDPDLRPGEAPWQSRVAKERGIRWAVGAEINSW